MPIMSDISLWDRVEHALDEIRPHLAVDGGNVELVEITPDLIVRVKWLGTCEHCHMSAMTMKAGVQEVVQSKVPEIILVEAINGVLVN
jgi:Fe-S cluster biogenesis protein NfuA